VFVDDLGQGGVNSFGAGSPKRQTIWQWPQVSVLLHWKNLKKPLMAEMLSGVFILGLENAKNCSASVQMRLGKLVFRNSTVSGF
jgi:hypothetical protein